MGKKSFFSSSLGSTEQEPPIHIDVPPIITQEAFSQSDVIPTPTPPERPVNKISAADMLARFLKENNIKLTPTIMDEQCAIIDGGIVLNDKPLVKIAVEYR